MNPLPPPSKECSTVERARGGGGGRCAEVCLIFLLSPRGWSSDAAAALRAGGASGFGEGLLVCILLGMHLFVQEVAGQFIPIVDLQLGNRPKHMSRWTWECTPARTI